MDDNREWFMMMMVREDAFIFINHRRSCPANFLTLIRFFSIDILMMMVVIEGEGRSRLFTFDDPFVWLTHSSIPFFANESLHHRNTDRVHQRDDASV